MSEQVLKVLIADDEPDVLAIMAKRVRQAGFDVVTASDGVEALDKAMRELPDILVLDINMPRKDGFEILKAFREKPPDMKWRPVIIVSSEGEIDSYRKGFSLQADHYLSKPCSLDDLINAVRLMASLIPLHM